MKSATMKITVTERDKMLRRPFKPSVTRDSEIPGLTLVVTSRRGFWAFVYQPRGRNPKTGRRWGGGVRHELGDAMLMSVTEARAAALAAKSQVLQGREPTPRSHGLTHLRRGCTRHHSNHCRRDARYL
jgi:hypothetical protein